MNSHSLSPDLWQNSHRSGKVIENMFSLEKSYNIENTDFVMEKSWNFIKWTMNNITAPLS